MRVGATRSRSARKAVNGVDLPIRAWINQFREAGLRDKVVRDFVNSGFFRGIVLDLHWSNRRKTFLKHVL